MSEEIRKKIERAKSTAGDYRKKVAKSTEELMKVYPNCRDDRDKAQVLDAFVSAIRKHKIS